MNEIKKLASQLSLNPQFKYMDLKDIILLLEAADELTRGALKNAIKNQENKSKRGNPNRIGGFSTESLN